MTEQLENFGSTTLDGAINDSTTSVTVDDGNVFPSDGNFRINIDGELMIVTSRATHVLTVARGAEGTTAASHSDGDTVKMVLTAEGLITAIKEQTPIAQGPLGANVRATSTQSIGNTAEKINLDTVDKDTDGFFDDSNDRLTIPAGLGGPVVVVAHAYAPYNSHSGSYLAIYKNGSEVRRIHSAYGLECTFVDFEASATDYYEAWGYSDASTTWGHASNIYEQNRLAIYKFGNATTGDSIGAKVWKSTEQSDIGASAVQVTWDSIDYDTDNMFDDANDRFTVPVGLAGTWLVGANMHYDSPAAAQQTAIRVNGTAVRVSSYRGGAEGVSFSEPLELNGGDYVEIWVTGAASGTDVRAGSDDSAFWMMLLHSSGTRTGNARLSRDSTRRTAGSITLNSTSWVDVGTLDDLVIAANPGDILQIMPNMTIGNEAVAAGFDYYTMVGGSAVNSIFDLNGTTDYGPWYCGSGQYTQLGAPALYTVQPGDIEDGKVTLRLRYRTSTATNKTLFAAGAGGLQAEQYVTNLKAGGGGAVALRTDTNTETGGNISVTGSTSWTDVPTLSDLTVAAKAGDQLLIAPSFLLSGIGADTSFDVVTRVGGSPVNYISGQSGGGSDWGVAHWYFENVAAGSVPPMGGVALYTVQAGDIENGNVTLRMRFRQDSADDFDIIANTNHRAEWYAINLTASGEITVIGAAGRGTSFPSGAGTGTEFHRTDIRGGMDFMYDGARWVSKQIFEFMQAVAGTTSYSADTIPHQRQGWDNTYDVYLVDFDLTSYWSVTHTGSNHWDVDLEQTEHDNTSTLRQEILSTETGGDPGNNLEWNNYHVDLDLVWDTDTYPIWRISFDEIGSAGAIYPYWTLRWRLIAT